MIDSSLSFTRFLQLAGPALPGSAFVFADGIRRAVEEGIVTDDVSALGWIGRLLEFDLGRFEAPLLARLVEAWTAGDGDHVVSLNDTYLAGREGGGFRTETVHAGQALVRLLARHPGFRADVLDGLNALREPALPAVWAAAAAAWDVCAEDAVAAYLRAWADHQISAAAEILPFEQEHARRILAALGTVVPRIAAEALMLEPKSVGLNPALASASLWHQSKYPRLFGARPGDTL